MSIQVSFSILILVARLIHGDLSPCFMENVTWLSPDILDIVEPVADYYECQQLCADTNSCSGFTWTSADNHDAYLFCFLFGATTNETSCSDCISGPARYTCSSEFACTTDHDNVLDAVPGVTEEVICKDLCSTTSLCSFYTWYDSTHFPSFTCILVSSCDFTDNTCSGCFSGPPDCEGQNLDTGLIISGGWGEDGASSSVEVYVPATRESCSLPALPDDRVFHTMNNLYICGGDDSPTSCLHFSDGEWTNSYTLLEKREWHSSWLNDAGLVLMGGDHSRNTSEFLQLEVGGHGYVFPLKYHTSGACAIPDLIEVVITGGAYSRQMVSRYNMGGHVKDLPQLIEGRWGHGCGSYWGKDGRQILLVAGGYDTDYLSSTEMLAEDSDAWMSVSSLPRAVTGIQGASIGKTVFMTGGQDVDHSYRAEILEWSVEKQEWFEREKMKMSRSSHAVSVIKLEDSFMKYCA